MISRIIRTNVFGVDYSVNEWKFLNSAILAVESFIEDEEPVPECEASLPSTISSSSIMETPLYAFPFSVLGMLM